MSSETSSPENSTPPLDPERFDFDPGTVWVLHCADGPSPVRGAGAAVAMLERETRPWRLDFHRDIEGLPARVRAAGSRVLGARATDLTLTATTSSGLVAVAQGYPWRAERDIVVTPEGEFPTNAWPWRALSDRGMRVERVPLWDGHLAGRKYEESTPPPSDVDPESRLLAVLDERPDARVLAASWVRFQDGLVLDLGRLADGCRERGVDLVIDGIQGAGTLPLDLESLAKRGLGAFATGGHKGLLGVHGLALLWTSPSLRARLVPTGSWLSVEDGYDFERPQTDLDRDWLDDGRRLEQGVPNLLGCALFAESLEFLDGAGIDTIARHVAGLRARFLDSLAKVPAWSVEADRLAGLDAAGRLGSIVALHHGGRGEDSLRAAVRAGPRRGVYASVREGYLRVAFHGYHSNEDVDRVVEWLADVETKETFENES